MIPPADLKRVRNLLLVQQWIFAKTMPDNPHWYTLRNRWERDEDFAWTVETIRRYGYEEIYEGHSYTVLDIDDMKYWTMGAPVAETILINRKYLTSSVDAPANIAFGSADDRASSALVNKDGG
jgi:hypothetical protein